MSRRLKGYRGVQFSLTKMHRSTNIFMGLSHGAQVAWSAFDRKNSARRSSGQRASVGGSHSLI